MSINVIFIAVPMHVSVSVQLTCVCFHHTLNLSLLSSFTPSTDPSVQLQHLQIIEL